MIPLFRRQSTPNTLPWAGLLIITLSLAAPVSLQAQDTNPGACTANTMDETGPDNARDDPAKGCVLPPTRALDWVPIEDVPLHLQDRQCKNCGGRYMDPLEGVDTRQPPDTARIEAAADSVQIEANTVVFTGSVAAQQGYRQLYGDNAVIERDKESAVLTGNVTLREPGVLVNGKEAQVFSETDEASVKSAEFVFHERHMRGSADLLERDEFGYVHIHDGNFSYCAPGEDDWAVRADNMILDFDDGLATAYDATIEVEGVPIFYAPWFQFPLDDRRRTGFLWPNFGNDSTGGLDITVPFYLNLAPNYDALYAPRFIEERGLNNELYLRYLSPFAGRWTFGGAYMHKDDRYADQIGEDSSSDRWLTVVKQSGLFRDRWRSRIDYSKASDVDYLQDLETSNLDSQRETSLLQLASLDYLGKNWLVNLEAQQFQSLANDIRDDYQTLPELTAQYWGGGQAFTLQPVFMTKVSNFDTDEERVTGQRLYAEAGLTYPMRWLSGFLQPTIKYRQLNYDLSESVVFTEDTPSSNSALASLDGGLVFERRTEFGGSGFLQTLEPRMYYLYSEYDQQFDQPDFDSAELTFTYNQLFRETRFSGHDRLDDANQIAVGLTSNLIDEQDGANILRASIGQIYYFRDRKVRLLPTAAPLNDAGSEIAGELDFTPNDALRFRTSLVYDPFEGNMNAGNFHTSYRTRAGGVYNVGYSYRRPLTTIASTLNPTSTAEAHLSAYIPLADNWSIFGATNYSTKANQSVEDMIGVEYDTCCWTVRLLYLRYFNNQSGDIPDFGGPDLERENTAQFQILLKGMGGFGDRITDIMQEMIRGFDERDF
ncbi:MAG: LPS assembly protein LptD [Gammaproteobacteria bacterium]|nr:LPS assembly protein LptD [Gammaproteobacteria bacterium]